MIRADLPPYEPLSAPAWARPRGPFRENSDGEALFFAGAALAALDSVAKSDPPWAGVWRRRLALKGAAAVAQNLLKRREDEAALRDAVALAKPGQELGPAGRVYAAFRVLAGPGDPFRPKRLAAVAADLQSPLDPGNTADLAAALGEAGTRGRPAPVVAAAAAAAVTGAAGRRRAARASLRRRRAGQDPRLADAAAAARRRAVRPPRHRRGTAAAPGRGRLEKLVALAYARAALAALDLAQDLSRRAARLADAAPKLRAKGKTGAIEALLADDAVSAAAPIANLSDRARRRLFERLVALGAARELTGRATFRLYGL